jgi:hypothetical protein
MLNRLHWINFFNIKCEYETKDKQTIFVIRVLNEQKLVPRLFKLRMTEYDIATFDRINKVSIIWKKKKILS